MAYTAGDLADGMGIHDWRGYDFRLIVGDFSPAECSLLLSPSPFFLPPSLYLFSLAGHWRITVRKQFLLFFFHLRVARVGKGV